MFTSRRNLCVDDQEVEEPARSSSDKMTDENGLLDWTNLPQHILIKIFLFLDPKSRRHASVTCKEWRECYFYPKFWRNIQLCRSYTWCCKSEMKQTTTKSWKGARLMIDRCGQYADSVIIFPFTKTSWVQFVNCAQPSIHCIGSHRPHDIGQYDIDHQVKEVERIVWVMSEIQSLLKKLRKQHMNMNSLQLNFPQHPNLCYKGNYDQIHSKKLWKKLAALLQLSPSIQHLKFGSFLDVIGKSNMLSELVQLCGKTLQTLHCPVYLIEAGPWPPEDSDEEENQMIAPNLTPFKQLVHLTDLSLNLCYVTDKLLRILAVPDHCPMTSLSILCSLNEDLDDDTTNECWQALVAHSPQLKVKIAFQFDGGYSEHVESLLQQAAIPLHQLKLVSSWIIPKTVFELLQNNFKGTLHHLELICPGDAGVAVSIGRSTEPNPVVLTMRRCNHITHLVIAGFQITADDVVGIARLSTRQRGKNIDVLCIQGSVIKYEEPVETEEDLIAEVSKCLGKDWQPMDDMDSELTLWELMETPLFPKNNYGSGPTS